MQHFADSGARDKRQREEREERDEPQLSLADPCLADHVQLGCPEHVQLGSAEHVLLFLAAVGEVKVCREARNKTMTIFRRKTAIWCKHEAHQLASAHAQVDQAFAKAKALSEGIQFELLTSCVHDCQWQPFSDKERKRVIANKTLATTAVTRSSASASGHSTPARRPHAGGTLQYELKMLDSSTRVQPTYVMNPEQIERSKAAKVALDEKRRHDAADPPYHPGSDFQPDNLADRERLSQERERLSQVPQHVSDRTSRWSGTEQFWAAHDDFRFVGLGGIFFSDTDAEPSRRFPRHSPPLSTKMQVVSLGSSRIDPFLGVLQGLNYVLSRVCGRLVRTFNRFSTVEKF